MANTKQDYALSIIHKLVDNGFQALYAGGFVRDRILGTVSDADDIDIATDATPSDITSLFNHVVGVGEHFGVMLVIVHDVPFEVATFRTDHKTSDGRHPDQVTFSNAETDACRRDFTINGLFYDPKTQKIIDYVNGSRDLQDGIIRTIGDPQHRFKEDYLRMLRAIRFTARFSFTIDTNTWQAIQKNASSIVAISQERIFQELNKMLLGPHPDTALSLLDASGLLVHILPEVHALKGVEQPLAFHPEGDVFVHTVKTLSFLEKPSSPVAAWSALLHDIGKPATFTHTDRIRFNNHARISAVMAKQVLQRLKSSKELFTNVYACIDNHMHFINVTSMRLSTLKKFLSRPTLDDELDLHRADCLASHGNIENYTFLCAKKKELDVSVIRPKPLLTGKHLISLGFTPGPLFGYILGKVFDLQLENAITTSEDACCWVERNREALMKKEL